MDKENLLALRVMRLTKPSMVTSTHMYCEDEDILQSDPSITGQSNGLKLFNTGQMLMLPQSFGNIFLGETFVSYISVHNDSTQEAYEILAKADLQTSSQRLTLSQPAAVAVLPPDQSIDDVIKHEVKELGTHILVCSVSYKNSVGTPSFFRKFFKFQVMKPLDVKTKFYGTSPEGIYLEAQIQNITPNAMCMEKVNLEPSSTFHVKQLNSTTDEKSTFGNECYIQPNDARQYLFQLSMKNSLNNTATLDKRATSVGKLDIVWKTILGERGRLQTSQLQRAATPQSDLNVEVVTIPQNIKQMKDFELECKVTNCSERPRQLTVYFENQSNVLWKGISNFDLSRMGPKCSIPFKFNLIAITPGLLAISGLRLFDNEINRTYEFDELSHILVDPAN